MPAGTDRGLSVKKEYRAFQKAIERSIPARRIITDPLKKVAIGVDASFYRLVPEIIIDVESEEEAERPEGPESGSGVGGGGGGGGAAAGRPVAVITIDQEGVRVEPVFDATKVALAFFTMLGSIFFMGSKMRKASR